MSTETPKINRRDWLRQSAAFIGAAAVAPLLFTSRAEAADKMAKTAVNYRDKPKGSEMCSNCKLFIPASTPTADGECKAVAGKISPKGWCDIYVPKS
jgi:anaerobic selenocysteine-containing dehydrogenase